MTCAETFLHDPLVDWTSGKRTTGSSSGLGGLEAENPQVSIAWVEAWGYRNCSNTVDATGCDVCLQACAAHH